MPHMEMKSEPDRKDATGAAKLLVLLLAFAWGFSWIATAIALRDVTPWSLRFAGAGIGTVTLFAAALLTGHSLKVPRDEYKHIMVAGFLNVAAFQILSAFAQTVGDTSRVVIVTYSMPIWATLFAFFLIGERLNGMRLLALALCVAGLTILVWPLFSHGFPPAVFLALGCALTWSFAVRLYQMGEGQGRTARQCGLAVGVRLSVHRRRHLHLRRLPSICGQFPTVSLLAVLYVGVLGVGLAHFLWWSIVDRLPAVTASIGALLVPVVGVIASVIFLGERPTLIDIAGFVLDLLRRGFVLLQPNVRHTEMPE